MYHTPFRGQIATQPAHLIDLMTAFVEISGATYPKKHQGHERTL